MSKSLDEILERFRIDCIGKPYMKIEYEAAKSAIIDLIKSVVPEEDAFRDWKRGRQTMLENIERLK